MLLLKSLCILSIIRITYEQRSDPGVPCPNDERGVCRHKEECSESDRHWHGDCGADINYTILVCCIASVRSPDLKYYTIRQLPDRTQCGQSRLVNKIYNGDQTAIGEYPWMAALQYVATISNTYDGVGCGGTLITEKFILTAAHCVINETPESIRVLLGDWNITSNPDYYIGGKCDMCTAKNESAPLVINATIDKIIQHEFYSPSTMRNDIALLRLETPVNFTDYVRPVCLPTEDFPALKSDDGLWLAGWGTTESNRPSDVLLKAQLYFLAADKCLIKIQRTGIHKTEFCAYNTDRDACRGDSGGPLIKNYKDKSANWFQLGIVGSGYDCSIGAAASIYTRVSFFVDWIIDHIAPSAEIGSRCKTPDNKNGKCVLVSDCPVLEQQYLQPRDSSEVELVRRSLCGVYNSDLVCCRVSARKRGNAMEGSSCKTPKPERIDGKCERITNCPVLKNASNEYMLKSQCGFDDELLVCCKMQDIVVASEPKYFEEFPSASIPNRTICGQIRNDRPNGEYPWLVAVMHEIYYLRCGGSLINKRFVLSSAFCLKYGRIASYTVLIGTGLIARNLDCHAPHMQNLTVEEVIPHPFYHEGLALNNIALARLKSDVTFDDYVSPVCLPPLNWQRLLPPLNLQQLLTGTESEVVVAGWGTTPDRVGYSVDTIVNTKTGLLDAHICVKNSELKTVQNQKCCIPTNDSMSVCLTEPGGAIMRVYKDQHGQNVFLEGIYLTGGLKCNHRLGPPNYNVGISAYTSWIVRTLANTT